MISKNLRVAVGILGGVCFSGLVACSVAPPVSEAQAGTPTASSLAALGVVDTSQEAGGSQLFGDAHRPLGRAIVRAPQSYIVELGDDVVDATWNDERMDLACNGADISLVMDGSKRWSSQGGGATPLTSGCLRALEIGRLLAAEAGPETRSVTPKMMGECHTWSTWVFGTGNCTSCLNSLPDSNSGSSCSDGWASTSCSSTRCYGEALQQ